MKIKIMFYDRGSFDEAKSVITKHGYHYITPLIGSMWHSNHNADCLVSFSDSFGTVDGSIDGLLLKYYFNFIERTIHDHIKNECFGELPVGSSFFIDVSERTLTGFKYLCYTPIKRKIEDHFDANMLHIILRSIFVNSKKHNVESIMIPWLSYGSLLNQHSKIPDSVITTFIQIVDSVMATIFMTSE